jgi:3-oxoacyl-[acyl-carrier protein] reductase
VLFLVLRVPAQPSIAGWILRLPAHALAEQGIGDAVQVNSIVPGAVMTGRRRSFLEKWAPAHKMSVEEARKKFPEDA